MYYIVCEAPLPIPHRNYTHAAAGQYVTDRCRVIARYIEDLQDEINRDGSTVESIRAAQAAAEATMHENLVTIADSLRRNLEN